MVDLVIGLFGPTASGKSDVAAAVTALIPAEVVSADAMQVYDGLPILTNRSPYPERLVGIWPLSHTASVGEYAPLAHAAVDEILAAGRTPLVVGGTGLYFRAALAELELPPPPLPGARERWERLYDDAGAEAAHTRLAELDWDAAARLHPNDRRRVVRALELAEAGSSLVPQRERLFGGSWRHPTLVVALDVPKPELERRIAERTRRMFERGIEDEVRRAYAAKPSQTAAAIIGLHEVASLPREEAVGAVIARTRRYAAYQRKWLRRLDGVVIVAADRPPEETAAEIVALARTRERLSRP
ncbi:MAG TPA: tRNA (adenosine(37)-N6)-dimethylallyltransferase MiaA [Gaiellaceae bacterium]|nr:tRNA (adenosine(37)-N6)-dimethylallyltransferase MiaA [Gaiellaceae bacterium]